MKPKILLRIASIIILIHGIGHTLGNAGWKGTEDPIAKGVVKEMTVHQFPFMGASHSIGDYYEGYI
ncbi:MAG TPA: hypothetical protein VGI43_02315, partial [Mucilaginibacter sp.]